ncbi:MAG: tRNA 2-selenouridine(34) synthase MnmH [Caulobacteraceae bacterium]|nr:tRNA 2-selenouridine(34) synthase MnmH [Caulobacter sp.]
MIRTVDDLGPQVRASVDTVIDVRSPGEFAQDHAPGAINLPVLSDAERAEVGAVYVQDDSFRARRLGGALVARNIAAHLEGALAGKGGGWRPLVYCWRGGQRSGAMAAVLEQVGWRTALLRGGYKTYRAGVVRALYEGAPPPNMVLLDGPTGAGKTEMLHRLAALGVQTLDLEGLAQHRGSLLGALPGLLQPSQKLFESRLAAALAALDPSRPVLVEAESSRVGERILPPALWSAMQVAPVIRLDASARIRAGRLAALYDDAAVEPGFAALLDRLPRHFSREEKASWRAMLAGGDLPALALALIERHYDPAYEHSSASRESRSVQAVVDGADLEAAAAEVRRALALIDRGASADRTAVRR